MTVNDKNDELRLNHIITLTNGTVDENHTDITSSTIKNCTNQEKQFIYILSQKLSFKFTVGYCSYSVLLDVLQLFPY
jgi:hypothetical protein